MLRCICKNTTAKMLIPFTARVATRVRKLHLKRECASTGILSLSFNIYSLPVLSSMSTEVTEKMVLNYEDIIKLKGKIVLIDVREPAELEETGSLPNSINIPLKELKFALEYLSDEEFQMKYDTPRPKLDTPLVFSCRSGNRSMKALQLALEMGFKNARHYGGGFLDWEQQTGSKN